MFPLLKKYLFAIFLIISGYCMAQYPSVGVYDTLKYPGNINEKSALFDLRKVYTKYYMHRDWGCYGKITYRCKKSIYRDRKTKLKIISSPIYKIVGVRNNIAMDEDKKSLTVACLVFNKRYKCILPDNMAFGKTTRAQVLSRCSGATTFTNTRRKVFYKDFNMVYTFNMFGRLKSIKKYWYQTIHNE